MRSMRRWEFRGPLGPVTAALVMLAWTQPGGAQVTGRRAPGTSAAARADGETPDRLIRAMYESNSAADWRRFRALFLPGARIESVGRDSAGDHRVTPQTVDEFIVRNTPQDPRRRRNFRERELARHETRYGGVLHAWSAYEARVGPDSTAVTIRGVNSFQLTLAHGRWWITHLLWTNDRTAGPLPTEFLQPARDSAGARGEEAAREVAAVEARVDTALARRDTATLARLVADSFTFVHAMDGRVDTREAWLAEAARGAALSRQRNARIAFDTTLTVYGGHTAMRTSRVRLRIAAASRESWLQQTMVYVREPDGWRLAYGQGTRIYDGPVLDTTLYRRYAGRYVIDSARALVLEWDGYALMARWPNGTRVQSFLASPTDELVASPDLERLRFTLGADGQPTAVSLVQGTAVRWRAERAARPPP